MQSDCFSNQDYIYKVNKPMYSIEYRYTDWYIRCSQGENVHVRTTVGYMAYCTSRKKFHHCGLHKYMRVRTKIVDCRGDFDPYMYAAICCMNHCMC